MAEMSTITRLRVGNEDFLVAAMIERCPKSMMIRELLQNALEAAQSAPDGERRVEFSALTVDGARKLALWNAGRGLTAAELYRMCDIAASINKVNGLDANFGMGAKVASLPSNQHGMRYRSCRDGVVHEVVLGKRGGTYGRLHQPGPDGRLTEIVEVTALAQAEGRDTASDWTEVVLLGNRAEQDTVADPFDGHPRSPANWLIETIGGRYFRFLPGGAVTLQPGIHPVTASYALRSLEQRLAALPHYERVALPDGVAIHYAYDAPHPDKPGANLSQASGLENAEGMAGIVFRDEIFAVLRGAQWRREAPSFGVPVGARHVSILVELPPDHPVQAEGYREFLRYRGGAQAQVRLADFAPLIAEHQPGWLKEILAGSSPSAALVAEAQQEMGELLRSLGVARRRPPRPRTEDMPPPATPVAPPAPRPVVIETAPALFLLRGATEVADAGLTFRAACYYPESHQLHINLTYPAVAVMASMLTGSEDSEEVAPAVQAAATEIAERSLVMRVARALVHGLAKRGRPREWNDGQLRVLLSAESLTLAADDVHAGLTEAQDSFRQSVLAVPAAE